jgi:hypothetical protein
MKKLVVVLLVLLCTNVINAGENIPYISPGIRIGWDFSKKMINIEPKISLGIVGFVPGFLNFTISTRAYMARNKNVKDKAYYAVSIQHGRPFEVIEKRKAYLINGGGLGLSFDGKEFSPRITIFTGMVMFMTADFTFKKGKSVDVDVGILGVLPIPLKKLDWGSPGG